MKHIKTLSVLMILTGICFSCQKPELDNLPVSPVTVESLITPRDNMSLSISNATSGLTFEWEASEWHGEGKPRYRLVFDVPGGDFSEPCMTFETESDTITLAQAQLREVFDAVKDGDSRPAAVTWSVVAISGEDELLAEVSYNLVIDGTPTLSRGDVLRIGGEGTEEGHKFTYITGGYYNTSTNFNDMLGRINGDYYEMFTLINADKPFWFYSDENPSETLYFKSDVFVKAESSESAAVHSVAETAIYRIRINLQNNEVRYVKVNEVMLDYPWGEDNDAVLEYVSKGKWQLLGYHPALHLTGWAWDPIDIRYKFNMALEGLEGRQGLGKKVSNIDQPDETFDASYWHLQITGGGTWDEALFRFPKWMFDVNDNDRYSADVILYLNDDKGHYTHEFVNVTDTI